MAVPLDLRAYSRSACSPVTLLSEHSQIRYKMEHAKYARASAKRQFTRVMKSMSDAPRGAGADIPTSTLERRFDELKNGILPKKRTTTTRHSPKKWLLMTLQT